MATFVAADTHGYKHAGEQLRAGNLIAFPTETVYGLGANALDPDAVLSIFTAKGRPLTDPLIVHVPTLDDAVKLVDLTEKGRLVFECLGRVFWPGPLTMVAKAVPELPLTLSAHTGFVGLRCPGHPVAQALLQEAKVPVAAPSANRFGHVSPTSAQHVMDDLGACGNLGILTMSNDSKVACCEVGIESTVVKIVPEENKLVVFRRGGISDQALAQVLAQNAEALGAHYEIVSIHKEVRENTKEAQQAPGQLLTHYAPDVDTYLFQETAVEHFDVTAEDTQNWVIIDFHGKLAALKDKVKAYNDLSPTGDIVEGTQHIFDFLRWAENVAGVQRVVITDVATAQHELAAALHDRMFRASSGKLRNLRF
uniref:Threonylcarbamoyl-AMP synthase n=1 Tax=Globisporangium ultimum (strain ATCC 200006 / CBS 805.95 / DAOM BR144) TaxID=431595 RepID=K3X5G0_GLOUD